MSSSALLTNSTASASVAAGGIIPLGSAVHGFGRSIKLNGNTINLADSGYYKITASATVDVTGATVATLSMNAGGLPVSGATAAATPAAAGEAVDLTLIWLMRKSCCCDPTALTFLLDVAATVTNFTVSVEKI